MSYSKILVFLVATCLTACNLTPAKKDPAVKISNNPNSPVVVTLEMSQFPETPQSLNFTQVSQSDFVNGVLGFDIIVGVVPEGFEGKEEANKAVAEGVFATLPGFVFSVNPATDVKITLSSRGRLQSVKKIPSISNHRMAVSLAEFSEVYPPLFRERYDLTISSLPGTATPFTYSYGFVLKSTNEISKYVDVLNGEGTNRMLFAANVPNYVLAKISTEGKCDTCIIQVKSVEARQSIKKFAELPALPIDGQERISAPARFSGLITTTVDEVLTATYTGDGSGVVTVKVNIPGAKTTVDPWCYESESLASLCLVNGLVTYFKSVNAVQQNTASRLLGGTSGIANYYLAGRAVILIKRDGVTVESKTVSFSSPSASILSSSTLPTWAIDDIRTATTSGVPEFSMIAN